MVDKNKIREEIEKNLEGFAGETTDKEPQAEMTNVLLPIIRKMTPTLIAQELVGVQPMSGPSTIRTGYLDETGRDIGLPYWVEVPWTAGRIFNLKSSHSTNTQYQDRSDECYNWCVQTFRAQDWARPYTNKFYFRYEKDRDWFLLRWS